jgi:hypothetical protein
VKTTNTIEKVKTMKLSINPFNRGNPMSLKDAAVVSTLSSISITILNQVANATFQTVSASPVEFAFNCVKTFLVSWAGNFITLAGLEQLIKRAEEKPSE